MALVRKRKNYERAVEMYNSGISSEKVAEAFGIKGGAMRNILRRRGVVFRPRLKYGEESCLFRHGLPTSKEQTAANNRVREAIEAGTLVPQPCECCGIDGTYANGHRKVQAHHDDYKRPLTVRWLCRSCHYKWHVAHEAENRNGGQG